MFRVVVTSLIALLSCAALRAQDTPANRARAEYLRAAMAAAAPDTTLPVAPGYYEFGDSFVNLPSRVKLEAVALPGQPKPVLHSTAPYSKVIAGTTIAQCAFECADGTHVKGLEFCHEPGDRRA